MEMAKNGFIQFKNLVELVKFENTVFIEKSRFLKTNFLANTNILFL